MDAKPFGKLCPRIQAPWPGPICYSIIVSDVAGLARDAISRSCPKSVLPKNYRAASNKQKREPSGKTKQSAEENVGAPGGPGDSASSVRLSPYVRLTAKRGSKKTVGVVGARVSPPTTASRPSGHVLTAPRIATEIPQDELKLACTVADSVISLCSRSLASCGLMSEPFPEDMFLLLVCVCGLRETEYRAEVLDIPHQHFSRLFEVLVRGPKWPAIRKRSKNDPSIRRSGSV